LTSQVINAPLGAGSSGEMNEGGAVEWNAKRFALQKAGNFPA